MAKKFQLGRGLGSLISRNLESNDNFSSSERIIYVQPEKIQTNPFQPRKIFAHTELEDLIDSIKEHGIIQPLIVSRLNQGEYELIAGERRLRAAKFLNLEKVPIIVREAKEVEKLELSLIENIQRKDLNPIERASAYRKLIDEFNFTQEELAKKLGKKRPSVTNTLRLLNLPEEIQRALQEEKITEGHAKVVLSSDNPIEQIKIFRKILFGGLTVSQTEKEIKKLKGVKNKPPKDARLEILKERLQEVLGTKVEISRRGKMGKIIIEFYSPEELNRIVERIRGTGLDKIKKIW